MLKEPASVLVELESDNSRLVKESIIAREAADNNIEFFAGVKLALDCMVTFGVKQIPEKKDENGNGLGWGDFVRVASSLADRTLTGHAARDAVLSLMQYATIAQWNGWYRRILLKDLRAGFSETTVNKVVGKKYPQFSIPVFSCQLAHDSANHSGKMTGEKIIQSKMDGVRILTIVYTSGHVVQFSRNGKELVNFPHIKEQFAAMALRGLTQDMVFDGEIMSTSFQDLMKQVHRKSDVQSGDATLHLFDMLPLTDFECGKYMLSQSKRDALLDAWFEQNHELMPSVNVLGRELVDLSTIAGQQRYNEINKQAIEQGFEGIMVKNPDAPYECKRTVSWLKLKPVITVDLTVVALEEGTGKNVGKLGALVCEGADSGKFIRVNVGSGLTDEQRDEMWADKSSVVGQIVEIKADVITQNQDGSYSLRFPRFERFRDDK
ncbi:CDC9 ATP-dependent DNA ligase [uncultured Caudovirales phage]|uniref:DNA ligase n=1 Tax=uncultured Caudovirales phage TaxID=2100421 RepID=A0A6J5LEB0_9CAUD|nr:CDC9 ATP-dependent DNA ligase [uncultured Caudovirales phage]